MNFRSLQTIGVLLASDDRKNLQELENEISSMCFDTSTMLSLIGRLLAAADPAKIADCVTDVGRLIASLGNQIEMLMGDLEEFRMETREFVAPTLCED
jgi:hypothetical protein